MQILMTLSLILARTLRVYSMLIWIRIMLSWFIPYPEVGTFTYYIAKIVDPYLGLFKTKKARIGALDFSPVIAIGLVEVIRSILNFYGTFGTITFGYLLATFIQALWSYCISLYLMLAGIMLLIRTIASYSSNPAFYNMGERFSSATAPITDFVRSTFFRSRKNGPYRIVKESSVNLVSLILVGILYFVIMYMCTFFINCALKLPF